MKAIVRESEYIARMLESTVLAKTYIEGLTKSDFLEDLKTQDAVIMKLLVIGEVAAQLIENCPDFVNANAQILWPQMKGMRNRMAHGYFEIDIEIVWDTCLALDQLIGELRLVRY